MHDDLAAYHRLLNVAYRRYLDADRVLESAQADMRSYFPVDCMPYRGTIGAPGSRIRRLYEDRERALLRLQSAHEKLRTAQTRVEQRRSRPAQVVVLSLCAG